MLNVTWTSQKAIGKFFMEGRDQSRTFGFKKETLCLEKGNTAIQLKERVGVMARACYAASGLGRLAIINGTGNGF